MRRGGPGDGTTTSSGGKPRRSVNSWRKLSEIDGAAADAAAATAAEAAGEAEGTSQPTAAGKQGSSGGAAADAKPRVRLLSRIAAAATAAAPAATAAAGAGETEAAANGVQPAADSQQDQQQQQQPGSAEDLEHAGSGETDSSMGSEGGGPGGRHRWVGLTWCSAHGCDAAVSAVRAALLVVNCGWLYGMCLALRHMACYP